MPGGKSYTETIQGYAEYVILLNIGTQIVQSLYLPTIPTNNITLKFVSGTTYTIDYNATTHNWSIPGGASITIFGRG